MPRLTLTQDINAPPEVVWRVLSDPNLYAQYVTFTDEVTWVSCWTCCSCGA